MRNRFPILLSVMLALLVAGLVLAAQPRQVKLTGEVLCLQCYLGMDASGPSHAKCGLVCAQGGAPMGLLVNGKAYLLLSAEHPAPGSAYPVAKLYSGKVGRTATVTGRVIEKGGIRAIVVSGPAGASSHGGMMHHH